MNAFAPMNQHESLWNVGENCCSDQKEINTPSVHKQQWAQVNIDRKSHYLFIQIMKSIGETYEILLNWLYSMKMLVIKCEYISQIMTPIYSSDKIKKYCHFKKMLNLYFQLLMCISWSMQLILFSIKREH